MDNAFKNAIDEDKKIKNDLKKMADKINKLYDISQNVETSVSLKALADEAKRISEKFDEAGKEIFGKINHSKLVYDFNKHKVIRVDDEDLKDDPSVCGHCCDCEEDCEACDQDPRYHDVDLSNLYSDEIPTDEDYYEEDYEDTTTGSGTTMISFHNCNFIFSDPYQTETFIKSIKSNKEPGDVY